MIIEQLESKIKALPYDKVIPFSYIDIESISIDTRRQYLHRLHDRGLISINDNYEVILNSNFIENSSAYNLSQFINKQITLPKQIEFHPELENLKQHRLRFNF